MTAIRTTLLLILLAAGPAAAAEGVPHLIDTDGPAGAPVTLELVEQWRVGGEDEDVIFGRIADVKRHANGETYILDNQICQVVVISPDGEHLRDLSREGDGPGDIRQPVGLVLLPDDLVGIGTGFPGKLVTLRLDGTPVGTHYPIGEPADGNIGVLISLNAYDGVLAATGGRLVFSAEGESHTNRFLSVTDYGLADHHRILEKTTPMDPQGLRFVETDDYYIDGSWTMGPGGLIYAPMTRDAYEVSVYDRDGRLVRVFGRECAPRRRSQEDKDGVSPIINVAGRPEGRDWDIADHDPCVARVMADPDEGTIWVLTPRGTVDQPDGIHETWDVFGADGRYMHQVAVPLGHEMNDGAIYLVGDRHLVAVKGTGSVRGDSAADTDEDLEPLEVICYEIR